MGVALRCVRACLRIGSVAILYGTRKIEEKEIRMIQLSQGASFCTNLLRPPFRCNLNIESRGLNSIQKVKKK